MSERKLTHGGDWAGFEIEYGRPPLDFSMNVNPLGISPAVRNAIAEAAVRADRYPDPLCRALTQSLAQQEEIPPEWIFCGSGAADIIFRLAHALKPAAADEGAEVSGRPTLLVTAPAFSEYETAFSEYGWNVRRHALSEKNGFHLTQRFLDEIGSDTDAVFLCEPNNPTGVTTDRLLLQSIAGRCEETGTTLVIDECFNGFLEDPGAHSMRDQLEKNLRLIILKAFTKLYGMAGVRLGYCLCRDRDVLDRIRSAGAPWNVSSLAQEAGIAALKETDHIREGLRIVARERPRMKMRMQEIGISEIFGEANYLLFRSRPDLEARMREQGILIRSCANYPGLSEEWFRVAVRTPQENQQLLTALERILDRKQKGSL